jgi:hypothetical protein
MWPKKNKFNWYNFPTKSGKFFRKKNKKWEILGKTILLLVLAFWGKFCTQKTSANHGWNFFFLGGHFFFKFVWWGGGTQALIILVKLMVLGFYPSLHPTPPFHPNDNESKWKVFETYLWFFFFFFFPSLKKSTYLWGKYEVFFYLKLWKEFLNQVSPKSKVKWKAKFHMKSLKS